MRRTHLGTCLVLYRRSRGLSVRALALLLNLTPATLNRVERGGGMNHTTFQTLLNWLGEREGRDGD